MHPTRLLEAKFEVKCVGMRTVLSAANLSKALCTRCSAKFRMMFGSAFLESTMPSSLLPCSNILSNCCILPSVESNLIDRI